MTIETRPFDAADVLTTDARIAAYLEDAFETGDPDFIVVGELRPYGQNRRP